MAIRQNTPQFNSTIKHIQNIKTAALQKKKNADMTSIISKIFQNSLTLQTDINQFRLIKCDITPIYQMFKHIQKQFSRSSSRDISDNLIIIMIIKMISHYHDHNHIITIQQSYQYIYLAMESLNAFSTDKVKPIFISIIYILLIIGSSLLFALGGSLLSFGSYMDSLASPVYHVNYGYKSLQPNAAYLIITGVVVDLYVLIAFINRVRKDVSYGALMMNWIANLIQVVLQFGSAVLIAINTSVLSDTNALLQEGGVAFSDEPKQYQNMFNLYMANTIIWWIILMPCNWYVFWIRSNYLNTYYVNNDQSQNIDIKQ